MQRVDVHRFPTSAPDDVSGLASMLDSGAIDPGNVIAVLGKTEGNGCVNDFTRGFATTSYAGLLASRLRTSPAEVEKRVQFIMSGGTEGIMTPHVSVFVRRDVPGGRRPGKGLVAGIASTRDIEPEELGTMATCARSPPPCSAGSPTPASPIPPTCTSSRSSARS